MNPCDLCGAIDEVEYRRVYPRHQPATNEDDIPRAFLCPDCDAQFHWKARTKRVYRGCAPSYGYRSVNGRTYQHKKEIQVVEEIIRHRLSGESFSAIAARLDAHRVPTKQGGTWNANTVTAIFEREAPKYGVLTSEKHVSSTRFGYRKENGRVVHDEEEQRVIRWILKTRKDGVSYRRIAAALNQHNVPTKRGGVWSIPQVSTIVRREAVINPSRSDS